MGASDSREGLLTIGEVAHMKGVSVKALRYYDRIGVLKPSYVSPESGYRYYTLRQASFVDLLSYCVELGIPLGELAEYQVAGGGFDLRAIMERGRRATEERMGELRSALELIAAAEVELQSQSEKQELVGDDAAGGEPRGGLGRGSRGGLDDGQHSRLGGELCSGPGDKSGVGPRGKTNGAAGDESGMGPRGKSNGAAGSELRGGANGGSRSRLGSGPDGGARSKSSKGTRGINRYRRTFAPGVALVHPWGKGEVTALALPGRLTELYDEALRLGLSPLWAEGLLRMSGEWFLFLSISERKASGAAAAGLADSGDAPNGLGDAPSSSGDAPGRLADVPGGFRVVSLPEGVMLCASLRTHSARSDFEAALALADDIPPERPVVLQQIWEPIFDMRWATMELAVPDAPDVPGVPGVPGVPDAPRSS